MGDLPTSPRQDHKETLLSSLGRLVREQEALGLKGIRPAYLPYFFAFPLAMVLINIQGHIWVGDLRLWGFPATTVLFVGFALCATGMLVFATPRNITALSKLSAALTAAGLLPWLFLRDERPAFVCAFIFMAGVGGCLSCSSFSFVFALNNTERFWGSALMLVTIGLVELGAPFIGAHTAFRKALPLILAAGLCACMALPRAEHFTRGREKAGSRLDPSVWLALFILFSYFIIRIMNFYLPAFQQQPAAEAWGALTLLPVVICVVLQAGFRYSVWTMCNLFFISAIVSHALWYAGLPEAAYLFAGMDEVGLLVSFYLIGSVTNKFCGFRTHKLLVLLCITVIAALYVTSDLLMRNDFAHSVAVAVSAVLFMLFLLFSPAFSRHLFFSHWSEEFRRLQMTGALPCSRPAGPARGPAGGPPTTSLDDTRLSLREKQVVLLLLQGLTLRQIAPELGLTFSTVSTYSRTIYKKLGINSRAELFLLFGHRPADAPGAPGPKA